MTNRWCEGDATKYQDKMTLKQTNLQPEPCRHIVCFLSERNEKEIQNNKNK